MKKLEKELLILTEFLKGTGLSNRQIAERVGISAVAVGKVFDGQFPSKSIHQFFEAFPELSPNDLYGYSGDGKNMRIPQTEIEKQNAELEKENQSLKTNLSFLKLILKDRLTPEEKESLPVNFKRRNFNSTCVTFAFDKATHEVTQLLKPVA